MPQKIQPVLPTQQLSFTTSLVIRNTISYVGFLFFKKIKLLLLHFFTLYLHFTSVPCTLPFTLLCFKNVAVCICSMWF